MSQPKVIDLPPGHPGELVVLATQPRLYLIDDFVDERVLSTILAIADNEPMLIEQGIEIEQGIAGRSFEMPVFLDPVIEALAARMYERLGMDNDLWETLRFRRYRIGEYHPLHTDAYAAGDSVLILTAMLYLTDTPEGGETSFPKAEPGPILLRPRRGRLAIWFSYRPDGTLDEAARHEGLPVRAGEKVTLTNFVYKPLEYCRTEIQP